MHPRLERIRQLLESTAGALTPDQLTRRPGGRWSPAQILEHLERAFTITAAGLRRAMDGGVRPVAPLTREQRLAQFVVLTCRYIPSGRRSPKEAEPTETPDPELALSAALEGLSVLDAALEYAAQHHGEERRLLPHPILGPLSVAQWRRFHGVHVRHHCRQIRERSRGID